MNTIHGRQITCLLLVILSGWCLTMSAADGRDGWLMIVLACLGSLLFTVLCCLPAEHLPVVPWFDLPYTAFGHGGSIVYLLIVSALSFWSLCMAVCSSVVFLRTVSDGQWPIWLLAASVLICASFTAQNGIQKLTLWAEPVLWVVLAALLISLLLSWHQLDWSQLFPVLSQGWNGIPFRAYLLLSVPFGEVFYAAAVLGSQNTSDVRPGLLRACVLAGALLTLLYIRNICLLGAEGAKLVLYPSYTAASVLSFGESFQRGEVLISGSLIVCAVARIALLLQFLSGSVKATVGRGSSRQVIWLCAVFAGILCMWFAGSNEAFANAQELYQIIFFPIACTAAIILYIGIWAKTKS